MCKNRLKFCKIATKSKIRNLILKKYNLSLYILSSYIIIVYQTMQLQKSLFLLLVVFFCHNFFYISEIKAQKTILPRPKASPLAISTLLAPDNTYFKITYGQPMKKGREIFGNLVPYGKIWRTGANEATEITITKDVRVDKKVVKAGTYTLFSIPQENQWLVILNSTLGQWGAYKYDEIKESNVLEISVPVDKNLDEYEALTISFEESKKGADLVMLWDKTKVVVPFTVGKSK